MIPLPTLNSTCAYTFTTGFTTLNDIYTVDELMSFSEALKLGIDFTTYLYTPAGLAQSQYTTDAPAYQTDVVLHLMPVNTTGSELYVPSSLLATVPDPMVGCYNDLAIGVSLGLFENQTMLQWVINELNAIIGGVVGVSSPVKLYSLGVKYMSLTDFAALEATRTAAQSPYATLYQQLQAQIALTAKAQALNQYYQTTLASLGTH
jgi:hypothetical protein